LSKKQVVEIQCERCPRKEYVASATPALPPIVITIGETTHKFEDLCGSCRKAVEGHIAEITKKLDGRSPERKAKTEPKAKEKPPVEPAAPPNGSATPAASQPQRRPQETRRV